MTNLMDAIRVECERQHVGVERHAMLLSAWEYARELATAGKPLTFDDVFVIYGLAEPDSEGRPRITPVTFAQGGTAAPADVVADSLATLINEHWATALEFPEDVGREWLRQFLWIHAGSDGNGRVAWVLQQWLMNAWANPAPLLPFEW